jgi:predicted nucleic acid-binding protein
MKQFLDASILVESSLAQSPNFQQADGLVSDKRAVTSAHALAETYATLSGEPRFKINPKDAAQIVDDLAKNLTIVGFDVADYRELILSAPSKGIRGGSIYDALHAETARRAGCSVIRTLNVNHFKHVAPDLKIASI